MSASCALQQAKAYQCVADASKGAADSTLIGCVLGGLGAVLTGGAGIPLALAGCGIGRAVGEGEDQCVMPTCDAGEAASLRATLEAHGLERSPMCGGWVGAELTNALASGASVEGVVADSDAESMGIMNGDVVVRINDAQVYDRHTFKEALSEVDRNGKLEVDIWRAGALRRLAGVHTQDVLGVELGPVEMVPALIQVASVESGSPADRARMRIGDVIYGVDESTVLSIDQLRQKLGSQREGAQVIFQIRRDESNHDVTVRLGRRSDAYAF